MLLTGLWAYAGAQLASISVHPAELLAGAALAAAMFAVAIAVRVVVRPVGTVDSARRAATLRDRARRLRVPRQLDPDSAGRPRPRAPSAFLSAA